MHRPRFKSSLWSRDLPLPWDLYRLLGYTEDALTIDLAVEEFLGSLLGQRSGGGVELVGTWGDLECVTE